MDLTFSCAALQNWQHDTDFITSSEAGQSNAKMFIALS
jgi:hypothetical protein